MRFEGYWMLRLHKQSFLVAPFFFRLFDSLDRPAIGFLLGLNW